VIREPLMAVEGHDGVIFPPTFAGSEDRTFKGGYNIDEFPDGKNICLVDTVGSQANRIEPIFGAGEYAALVPQLVIKAGDRKVSILAAGHRAADAIVRCSVLQAELRAAFKALQAGDAEPLARVAPTSLVFGAWDSRDTQAKAPRLIASTIRAFDVRRLTRSAQFVPASEYVEQGMLDEPADEKTRKAYAERGFIHVPATATPGGVIATGGVRRDATLHLAALRLLNASDTAKTGLLRRYVLGLALTAFTHTPSGYLRQGCSLVLDPDRAREQVEVRLDGQRVPLKLSHAEALAFAKAAAKDFGVAPAREVDFDREAAKRDVAGDGEGKPKKSKKAK
jgi:CRISPR-associated protein Csb1